MTLYSENIVMEKFQIEIEYCTKCKWLLRASWISQELLSTFVNEIGGITLIPSNGPSQGKVRWVNPIFFN